MPNPKPWKAAVFGDVQAPYHCRDAVDIAAQILADFKPDTLVSNGDMWDLFNLSRYPSAKNIFTEKFAQDLDDEIDVGIKILKHLIEASGAKRFLFNAGNHEWRVARAISVHPRRLFLSKAVPL